MTAAVTRDQILAEITRSLVDDFDVDPALVSASARLREDLDLDSIDAVDLSVKMQELTGRRVEESTLRAIRTVGDVVDAVARDLARDLGPARARELVHAFQHARSLQSPIDPAMDAVLARLRGHVRLGLLSNAGRGARERLDAAGVTARFDDTLCSAEVGLAKPDPQVYRLAASRLGVAPSACAFVDDMPRNVDGARAVGMQAFLYARRRHAEFLGFLTSLGLPVP